ncbi:hypothetical protein [Flavobacterium sp.]
MITVKNFASIVFVLNWVIRSSKKDKISVVYYRFSYSTGTKMGDADDF